MITTNDTLSYDFASLSLSDLIAARDLYHVHLMNKANVIATAVGYYRIRKEEKWPSKEDPHPNNQEFKGKERTLEDSEVRPYSWPAILVFVQRWQKAEDLLKNPSSSVPPTFYSPNGKAVPVCVILAPQQEKVANGVDPSHLNFPRNVISGGFPLLTTVQGQEKIASFGCLVTDGHYTYALTNRHVTGDEGSEISTILDNEETVIGTSSALQIGRVPFQSIYPALNAENSYLNIDIGLIKVNDINQWKTEILGIGQMGELMDVNPQTVSLKLIGKKVTGFGAVSAKRIDGEIQALFYRYKSVGGFEYISDFLVGPVEGKPSQQVHHGDSGTILLIEEQVKVLKQVKKEGQLKEEEKLTTNYRPLGVLWGSHEIIENGMTKVQPYALSTFLGNVCNYLDIEVIRDWNLDMINTWGSYGHFKIGAYACELVLPDGKYSKLLMANQTNIGYTDDTLIAGNIVGGKYVKGIFVPLADVPDIVWRNTRPKDEANHFADMDEHFAMVENDQDLLQLNQSPAFLTVQSWLDFDKTMDAANPIYTTSKKTGAQSLRPRRGALPFRIWQCYNQMVKSLHAGNLVEFLVAGGTMSHNAGDACQPLHISYLHHGITPDDVNVHSDYETTMIAKKAAVLFPLVAQKATKITEAELISEHGKDAALRIIQLMRETVANFPPMDVLTSWRNAKGKGKYDQMWDDLGDRTAATIANGSHALAILWQSAWNEGNGDAIPEEQLIGLNQDDLMAKYMDPTFVSSYSLDDTALYQGVCY